MKQFEPYEQRMADEYSDLKTRMNKLCAFLKDETREPLPEDEFKILCEQMLAMFSYADALRKRMELHGINIDPKEVML